MSSKSTFSNSASNSYAMALYELANEHSELNAVEEEMKSLNKLMQENLDFKEVISSPAISKEEKANVMSKIADQNNFSKTFKKFIGFITYKNRLFFLNKIIESFLNIVSKNKGELKAKLVSSKNLSEQEKKNIQSELSKNFKSTLNIDFKYDKSLIAGLIIQIGSIMVDTSVKSKLKKLEKNMIEA